MKVLHVFKTYWPDTFGGVERVINSIAVGCAKLGVQSDVISLSPNPTSNTVTFNGQFARKAKLDMEIASTGFSRELFSEFDQICRDYDIIHYQFPWPFMDLLHLKSSQKKPSLVSYQSDIVKQKTLLHLYRPLMHRFLNSVGGIVATSDNYVETSPDLQRHKSRIKIIPNGLDQSDYPAASSIVKERWKTRFPKPYFLFVGVLRYYKGLHVLVEAAKSTSTDIVIAGDGPMRETLESQAKANNINNLHFVGLVTDEDKCALLDGCTAFVFPSHLRSEAFGMSLVEAAMFGKPMISCEIGTGTSFVNLNDITGIVVPPNNPDVLASAMNRIIFNPIETAKYGMNAKHRYINEFTSDRMCRSYYEIYRNLVE
jgi:glycosyltransferase involved in cell wall biosynthesis